MTTETERDRVPGKSLEASTHRSLTATMPSHVWRRITTKKAG